ncbi:hypothetical protein [Zongyangia hominis]|uniref:Uncharacterized protein n=1 Tax=Zongyangia hominis TaxID=2763677 RepID=A0A926E8S0_9FIRM|nr:hypothetical protein [Zongyangia hominis]MBC8569407.1 hypothetical protein [Zongyangia hominis]
MKKQEDRRQLQKDRVIFLCILALFLCGGLLIGARYFYPDAFAALKEESQAQPSSSSPTHSDRIYLGDWSAQNPESGISV